MPPKTKLPAVIAPSLLNTTKSVADYTTWVADQLAKGLIKPSAAKEMNQLARTMLAEIKVENGLEEMSELRKLVKDATEAVDRRKLTEITERYSQEKEDLGEFPVDPDGE